MVKKNVRYFYKFKFSGDVCQHVRLDNIDFNKITDEDNAMLIRSISEEGIKDVVWSCDSVKSLGPDGFNFGFIKFCWEEIKMDFIRAVQDFNYQLFRF